MAKSRSSALRVAAFVVVLMVVGIALAYATNLAFSTFGPENCQQAGIDCTFQSLSPHDSGYQGYGCTGGICSTNPTGPGYPGNLIRWSEYIASWDPAGGGQQVVVQGGYSIIPGYWGTCYVDNAHYNIDLHWLDGNNAWQTSRVLDTDVSTSGGYSLNGVYTTASVDWIVGSPDGKTILVSGDWIQASFSVHCAPVFGFGGGWYEEANQKSVIITGIGVTNWQQGQYLVGQQALADYHVGFVNDPQTGHAEWSIYITSGAQGGQTVFGPIYLTQTDGTISYTVQPADFNINGAPGTNFLIVHLKNALFSKSWDKTTTISVQALAFAPKCAISGFTPASPLQGDTITLNFQCTPAGTNPNATIRFIEVDWGYGSIDAIHKLSATATSDTFTAGSSGDLRAEVIAWAGPTQGTIPSPTVKVDITVGHQPTQNSGGGGGIPIWLILVLIAVVAAAVALILPKDLTKRLKIKPLTRVLILFGAIALVVIAWLIFPS